MREFKRQDRLQEEIKREVAAILRDVVKSPKLGFVTVTEVELSKDLKYAKIFYSTLGGSIERAESNRSLERTRGVVQAELAKRLRIRQVPQISYHIDKSLDYADRIDTLLDQIKKEPIADGSEDGETDS
jgi:ribosome-binding factor A